MYYHAIKTTMNQDPVKVLFLITKGSWGGAQRYVFDLATHLSEHGCEPVVAYGTRGSLVERLSAMHIRVHQIPALARDVALVSDIKSFFQIIACIRSQKPEVMHLNSSKAAALGALAARLCGVRTIVFTAHGWPFKENRNFLVRSLIYMISWFTSLLSTSTIVVSKSDERIGKRMWLAGRKIVYIPIGLVPPEFLDRDEAARALHITSASRRIVTNAELTANKGIRYALDAIAKLLHEGVDIEYFIISDGELRGTLEAQVRELDIANKVHFLGFVPDARIYMKAFDLFVLPSIKEGMPYVLLEAASAGLPIVATTAIDPEFPRTHPSVQIVPPADSDSLARAIKDALHATPHYEKVPTFDRMLTATARLYR